MSDQPPDDASVEISGVPPELELSDSQLALYVRDLKRASQLARKNEVILRGITEAAQDAVIMVDNDGRLAFWNPAAERMFGWSAEEALGREAHQLLAPQRYQKDAAARFAAFRETGTGPVVGGCVELEALCKDGHELLIELSLSSILVENRWHAVAVARDISERKKASQALVDSERRLRTIIDHQADGVLVLDRDGRVQFVNAAAEQVLGRPAETLQGEDFGFPMVPDDTTRVELLRGDGSTTAAEMRVVASEWDGAPASIVSLRDITEREQFEREREAHRERLKSSLVQTIQAVARALERRDPYTAGHQQRVAELAVAIAREMALEEDLIEGLYLGATIHDIGKIYIPAEILNRPGKLSEPEFAMIKSHPQVGYEIIEGIKFSWPLAEMVLQHHERLDGSGYPQGLSGDQIILESRILTVADVVEAIGSHRPYRAALGIEVALDEILKMRGTWYDPDVVDACLRVIREQEFAWST